MLSPYINSLESPSRWSIIQTRFMSFFDQFEKLRLNVPRLTLMNFKAKNSPYCNYTYKCANCHYSMGSDYLEDSHYNYWCYHNTNCTDCSYCRNCDNCYECLDSKNCSASSFLQDCEDCIDAAYCFDCQSLKDCFACIGLWRKQYYIYNKSYSKEEYFKTLQKLKKKPSEELRELFREVKKNRPHVFMHENHNETRCTGDYVYHSKNCFFCFDAEYCEDSTYLNNAINCRESHDISFAGEPPVKRCYEIMSGLGIEDCMFCSTCWHGKNLSYCEYCFQCEYCFGCIGLKDRKFYILNIPYKPDEYFKKTAEIISEMKRDKIYGKWFDSSYPCEDSLLLDINACITHSYTNKKTDHSSLRESWYLAK